MIKDKIYYLIDLCLEVQRRRDGNIESRVSKDCKQIIPPDSIGPTVFFKFSGHTGHLEISIHKNGWYESSDPDDIFGFYLDKEIDNEEFERCKTMLEEIIRKQKEKEKYNGKSI